MMNKKLQSLQTRHGFLWWVGRILLGLAAFLLIVLAITLVTGAQVVSWEHSTRAHAGFVLNVAGLRIALCGADERSTRRRTTSWTWKPTRSRRSVGSNACRSPASNT